MNFALLRCSFKHLADFRLVPSCEWRSIPDGEGSIRSEQFSRVFVRRTALIHDRDSLAAPSKDKASCVNRGFGTCPTGRLVQRMLGPTLRRLSLLCFAWPLPRDLRRRPPTTFILTCQRSERSYYSTTVDLCAALQDIWFIPQRPFVLSVTTVTAVFPANPAHGKQLYTGQADFVLNPDGRWEATISLFTCLIIRSKNPWSRVETVRFEKRRSATSFWRTELAQTLQEIFWKSQCLPVTFIRILTCNKKNV